MTDLKHLQKQRYLLSLNGLLQNPLPLIWLHLHLQFSLRACLRSLTHTRKRKKLRRSPELCTHLEMQRGAAGTVVALNLRAHPHPRPHPLPLAATPQAKVKSATSTLAQDAQRPQGVAKPEEPHNRSIPTTTGSKEARRGSKRGSR